MTAALAEVRARAAAWPEYPSWRGLTAEVLRDVARRRGCDFATALLYDRLQLNLGFKQRYGSQLSSDNFGNMTVPSLEDRSKVDEYRKALDMPPLAQYLAHWGDQAKKVQFPDE